MRIPDADLPAMIREHEQLCDVLRKREITEAQLLEHLVWHAEMWDVEWPLTAALIRQGYAPPTTIAAIAAEVRELRHMVEQLTDEMRPHRCADEPPHD